ncbi:hypothetical protein [Methanothermococcus sp.]|uniref:hypothetical protein n=1 Tax=Methanothermococcus sp. TaxID=2614238 RepID=UPI0025F2D317|nr:hypothetical protein [Methanothermococcus sp.]
MKDIVEFLQNVFISFLKLSFFKKFFITYVGCWIGFFSMLLFSKALYLFYTKNIVTTAGVIASKKFEVISGAVSSHVGYNYFSIVLSYFINNSLACTIILLTFPSMAYLYKRDMVYNRSSLRDYLNILILFYFIVVINPMTGIIGYNIDLKNIFVIFPHGIFEFAGFALSIVVGIVIANRIIPINNELIKEENTSRKNEHYKHYISRGILIVKIMAIYLLIGVAGFLEPLDWMIYNYAIQNNLNVLDIMIKVYMHLLMNF